MGWVRVLVCIRVCPLSWIAGALLGWQHMWVSSQALVGAGEHLLGPCGSQIYSRGSENLQTKDFRKLRVTELKQRFSFTPRTRDSWRRALGTSAWGPDSTEAAHTLLAFMFVLSPACDLCSPTQVPSCTSCELSTAPPPGTSSRCSPGVPERLPALLSPTHSS